MSEEQSDPAARAGEGDAGFEAEVERLRASGVLGESGRLLELFTFLAERGAASAPASQAEIAQSVFGQSGADSEDATVRVYIHRLRKRLEDHYAAEDEAGARDRLTIPAGTYALRLLPGTGEDAPEKGGRPIHFKWLLPAALLIALGAAFLGGWLASGRNGAPPANAVWQPFVESDRPIMVVVGDYYIFGEIDPVFPEQGRLIRDFQINSETDLARAQEADPQRYGATEDFGLNYLPFSSAYGLQSLMPVLAQSQYPVGVMPASAVNSDTFRYFNVVYVGLFSGMGLIEDINFMSSSLAIGESYDELIDLEADRTYISEEARRLATTAYYRDYGYLSVFREPGGALVAVVAGARDTGLRAIAPIVAASELPPQIAARGNAEGGAGFEALFEVTGQQGADLDEKLLFARRRP